MTNAYADYPYMIIKDFLLPESISSIVEYVRQNSDAHAAEVKKMKKKSVVAPRVDTKIRKTLIYKFPETLQYTYDEAFKLHQKSIEDFFTLALTTSTTVQLLQYEKDFFYIKHADDSSEIINADKETIGFKLVAANRKLTTVLFATSFDEKRGDSNHFTGGELRFNYLYDMHGKQVTLKPAAGDMVIFPSNPIYSHEVLPVSSGNRITLVQWHNAIIA